MARSRSLASTLVVLTLALGPVAAALAQAVDFTGRPVSRVDVAGLEQQPEQFIRNHIRMTAGQPYDPGTVREDIRRLTHLGRFREVRAVVDPLPDGSVVLTYALVESPLIRSIAIEGNKQLEDAELLELVQLRAGDPVDPFLIQRGSERIAKAYQDRGYFVADAAADEAALAETGELVYRVVEGPRVRIRAFAFEGNVTQPDGLLREEIRSKAYFPIFQKGELNRDRLDLDADRLRIFYQNQGYLDARVGRRIDLSPDKSEAVVTFLVYEGPRYRVNSIRVEGNDLFSEAQIVANMPLKRGSAYSLELEGESIDNVLEMYGELGYLDARVGVGNPPRLERVFREGDPMVDVVVPIREGERSIAGRITVSGNETTKSKVVMRQVRGIRPGRPINREGVRKTQRRLTESPLFDRADVTLLGEPGDPVRDVIIEVDEGQTGQISFGAGVSSDSGLIGAIDLIQRNFDIADYPSNAGELVTGRAFRGAGQYFALSLQPGNEVSQYEATFREPYLFETNNILDTSAFFFERDRNDYDEKRVGGTVSLGRRFGDIWSASVRAGYQDVEISDIEDEAPLDVFAVEGNNQIGLLGFRITRNTTDSRLLPSRGSITSFDIERAGALGGDFDFTRAQAKYQTFWTVSEDFLGRKTILSWRVTVAHIFEEDEAPVFERLYAGGSRSFRGFEFRGVGPRGVRADTLTLGDEAVGGEFLLLTGLEYEFPLIKDFMRGVVFTDMGTVDNDVDVDKWRVSVGTGVRLKVPILFDQAPIALDLGFPVVKEDDDETQVFSFDLGIPIR